MAGKDWRTVMGREREGKAWRQWIRDCEGTTSIYLTADRLFTEQRRGGVKRDWEWGALCWWWWWWCLRFQ